jgi:uncharacterized coiled-coil protein SlyX
MLYFGSMAKPKDKPGDTPEQRIADLEHELRFKDERINELKDEIDGERDLLRRMEEHIKEGQEYLETFITTFGLVLTDNGNWSNGEFITRHTALIEKYNDLISRHNKLVGMVSRKAP